jgi:hypothetical protein
MRFTIWDRLEKILDLPTHSLFLTNIEGMDITRKFMIVGFKDSRKQGRVGNE